MLPSKKLTPRELCRMMRGAKKRDPDALFQIGEIIHAEDENFSYAEDANSSCAEDENFSYAEDENFSRWPGLFHELGFFPELNRIPIDTGHNKRLQFRESKRWGGTWSDVVEKIEAETPSIRDVDIEHTNPIVLVLWTAAAMQEHAGAQFRLYESLHKEIQSPIDNYRSSSDREFLLEIKPLAERYLIQASERGHTEAQFCLGKDLLREYPKKALSLLKRAAKKGHSSSQMKLAEIYSDGDIVSQDLRSAFKWWKVAAEHGNVDAQIKVAEAYSTGNKFKQNAESAKKWWELAAEQGSTIAQLRCGEIYYKGIGVPKDERQAKKWWALAAKIGNKEAQLRLDELNSKNSFDRTKIMAEAGNTDAMVKLGDMYYAGEGVGSFKSAIESDEHRIGYQYDVQDIYRMLNTIATMLDAKDDVKEGDFHSALKWWRKAADLGNADAQYKLGKMYSDGTGVKQCHKTAGEWWLKAGSAGHSAAQLNLSSLYAQGIIFGSRNCDLEWLVLSAEGGNDAAQTKLGRLLAQENNFPMDAEPAQASLYQLEGFPIEEINIIKYIELAAEKGDSASQHAIGCMHLDGIIVAQDGKIAEKWLKSAAEKGHANAQCKLGLMYAHGEGVSRDNQAGAKWLESAALQGILSAQYEIGLMHIEGRGVKMNYATAAEWLECAALSGHVNAQFKIGEMYYDGRGVGLDIEAALEWWKKAIDQGHDKAKSRFDNHHSQSRTEDTAGEDKSQKNTGNRKQDQKAQYRTKIKRAYEVLGASESDSFDQIKKKYQKLVGEFHPDKNPGKEKVMTKKTKRINAAFTLIKENRAKK